MNRVTPKSSSMVAKCLESGEKTCIVMAGLLFSASATRRVLACHYPIYTSYIWIVPIRVATAIYFPFGLKFTHVGTSSLLNYFKILIDLGFYTKFHS